MISWSAILHMDHPHIPEFSYHSEVSSMSSPFFRYPDDIGEAESFIQGIYSLA